MFICVCVRVCVSGTYFSKVPDQTEAVAVVLEALLLCQLREENRQKEAKGGKWGSYRARDGEGWLPARSVCVCVGGVLIKEERL